MRPDSRRYPVLLMTAVLAAAISGCGGGGGTTMDTGSGMTGGGGMPLDPPEGLTQSQATPVNSSSATDTLATLLPDSTNQFAPLSASIERDYAASTVTTSDSYIKMISSDGNNGFHVTYVVGGEERMIHFEEADYITEQYNYVTEVDGVQYFLWSYTDSYHGAEKNMGSPRYRYVEPSGFVSYSAEENPGDWINMSYGARTDAASLPTGSATYTGVVDADAHLTTDPSRASRQDMKGLLRLTADFDDSTLDGMILGIRVRTRGANGWNPWVALPDTTGFDIEDGRIVDGQFTATLIGTDSNAGAAPQDTVSGYEGGILGEFYGPAAEEVGGVLSASRDDRLLVGLFAGKQSDPNATPQTGLSGSTAGAVYAASASDTFETLADQGERFAPLTSAVRGDWGNYYEPSTMRDDDSYVKEIWIDDGTGVFHVTYLADGREHTVGFTAADYDPVDGYAKTDGRNEWLWSVTDSFEGDSDYAYLDVYGFGHWFGGLNYRTYVSVGVRTDPANMPAGSASYAGSIRADAYKQDSPSSDFRYRVIGDLNLMADFDAGTLDGTVSGIETRGQSESSWTSRETTSFEIGNGQIAGGQFTADLTGADTNSAAALDDSLRGYEGNVLGEFYGPAAEEVGGVFTATRDADQRVLYGALHGRKQ